MSAAPRRAALLSSALAREGGCAGRARGSAGVCAPRPSACHTREPGSPSGPQSAALRAEGITRRTGHGPTDQRHQRAHRSSARLHRCIPWPACSLVQERRS